MEHRTSLRGNTHSNVILQRCFNKYGEDKCHFSVLQTVDRGISTDKLLSFEKYWIDLLGPIANIKLDPTTQFNSTTTSKHVYQYNLNGHSVNNYVSVREASRQTSIPTSSIIQNCNGHLKSAGGYLWSYEDKVMKQYDLEKSKWKWKSVQITDTITGSVNVYKNIASAARVICCETDNFDSVCAVISSTCKGKSKKVLQRYLASYLTN